MGFFTVRAFDVKLFCMSASAGLFHIRYPARSLDLTSRIPDKKINRI